MLNFLFGSALKVRPFQKTVDLEAKLRGVNGYTGYGEVEFSAWQNGSKSLEVELRGVAGTRADIYLHGAKVKTVALNNGRADQVFETTQGDGIPDFTPGATVEIWQNGQLILSGVMDYD
ncbi:MAG: hypothetical protein AAGD92_08550 [Pseudomonadota bacterium]